MVNIKTLIKQYQAEYENACDDLYYGVGYKFWRTHNNSIQDDEIAKTIWHAAVDKMSRMDESKTNKNMKKNVVKLNEAQLKKIVAESVKKVLKEIKDVEMGGLQAAEEKYKEARQHKDLDVALDLLIEAYNILENYYERIRNISVKTGGEAISDKEYADFSRLYRAVYDSLQGIAESGFPEFTTEDMPFPLDGFEDLM